ncbi:hypothetical protein ABFV54_27900, partial [Pseudomonas syringae]|uniref:hypothetical protein n=1 Tax=Pseudomonas syringae TaxID=317 RepID=UPI0034D3C480
FVLPSQFAQSLSQLSNITFESSQKQYQAKIKAILPEADQQTGQLKVLAYFIIQYDVLKQNLIVNVRLATNSASKVNRILKTAI